MTFDERVSKAIDIIYVNKEFNRAQEALELLQSAADEVDADAYYFLGRCYAGYEFRDERFNFEVDDAKTEECFNKCIEMGSAVGILGVKRLRFEPACGTFLMPPYNSFREVWDAVCRMALEGEVFRELLIANAYYYGDAIELMEIDMTGKNEAQVNDILRKMAFAARDIYEDIYSKGMLMAYHNYKDLVLSGDYGMPITKDRYKWLKKLCAAQGIEI